MMLLKRLAVGPPSAMRLAVGLPISEIKMQVVATFGSIGDGIVLQAPNSQLRTLIVLGPQSYVQRMFTGKGIRRQDVARILHINE